MKRKIVGVTVGTTMNPSRIKEKIKPVTSVNGNEPDENGNVDVDVGSETFAVTVTRSDVNGSVSTDKTSEEIHEAWKKKIPIVGRFNDGGILYGITLVMSGTYAAVFTVPNLAGGHNIIVIEGSDVRMVENTYIEDAIAQALAKAKESGEFNGADGVSATHSWDGTTLIITSASGTSSADLKGIKGDNGDPAPDTISSRQEIAAVVGRYYELHFDKMDDAGIKAAKGSIVYTADGKVYLVTNANASSTYCIAKCVADLKGEKGDDYVLTEADKAEIAEMAAELVDVPEPGGGGVSVAQSDWNAGENEPGHILNRPFYSETRYETILDQVKMLYDEEMGFFLFQAPQFTVGQHYTITVNGTEYLSTAQDLSEFMGDGAVAFGDLSALSEDFAGITGSGEPFVLVTMPSAGVTMFAPLFECTEVTLSIAGSVEAVHPIPAKYLANVRAQKRYILNCDTQIASAAAPSPEEADTGELQAAITVIYQGTEHAAVVTERISHTIEGITVHVVEFFFADHNRNIRTGRWNHNAVYVDELIYTFAGKFQANDTAGTAPWLYAVPASNSSPVWYSIQNLTLPGITLKSPNGTKFWVTVDNSGNLTATQK